MFLYQGEQISACHLSGIEVIFYEAVIIPTKNSPLPRQPVFSIHPQGESMALEAWGMTIAGLAALIAGLVFAGARFKAAAGAGRVIVLGPVFEAIALAMFAAEHFFAARDLMGIVPRWLPWPLFWTYFFGAALLAAAISFIVWRGVRWSAPLLALFFLLIVVTMDLPSLPQNLHQRLFWTLTVRETAFAAGAIVLTGSVLRAGRLGQALVWIGRVVLAPILVFYAVQHMLFPRFVPGVPLDKLTPAWVPAPTLLAYAVGIILLGAGIGLLFPSAARRSAAVAGGALVLLTAFFYVPILCTEIGTPLVIEGLNYVGDTSLFAATILLAGMSAGSVTPEY
jgi:uncharacterized membrane protein